MSLMDILNQYAANPQPQSGTVGHFESAASQTPAATMGNALAQMFRSSSTPPFGQAVGSLFGQSNSQQQAGVLNHLVQALGPAALGAGGGVLSRLFGDIPSSSPAPTITPEQASQVAPHEVATLATNAQQQNPSIVDTLGAFYSQHPTLVKTLGVTALAVALGQIQKA